MKERYDRKKVVNSLEEALRLLGLAEEKLRNVIPHIDDRFQDWLCLHDVAKLILRAKLEIIEASDEINLSLY